MTETFRSCEGGQACKLTNKIMPGDQDHVAYWETRIPETPIEELVIAKIRERRKMGLKKYGVSVNRTDLSRSQWLVHAQEEAMDLAIYIERLLAEEPS